MKSDLNRQNDWLARAEELNDIEASQVNGGSDASFEAAIASLQASFARAQQRNIEMRKVTTEEGIGLKAAGKDVNPK